MTDPCLQILDYMKTKGELTDFIINYPYLNSKLGESIIFPYINYILHTINDLLSKSSSPLIRSVKFTIKGGLITTLYLKEFMREFQFDSIDRKTVENLVSKDSDYDATLVFKPSEADIKYIPEIDRELEKPMAWVNFIKLLFTEVEKALSTNDSLKRIIALLSIKIQDTLCSTYGTTLSIDGVNYNSFPLKMATNFYNMFPATCGGEENGIKYNYSNKDNLYLVFKTDEKSVWRGNKGSELPIIFPPHIALNMTHSEIKNKDFNFFLSRILGCLQLYEIVSGTPRRVFQNVDKKFEFTYNFELLDMSVDTEYDTIKKESEVGALEIVIPNSINKDLPTGDKTEFIKIYALNLGSVIYDNYRIFIEDKINPKFEKRCKRLLVFLRIYNIIKLIVYNKIIQNPTYSYLFPPSALTLEDKYYAIDTVLSTDKNEREIIAKTYPEYREIKEVESTIRQTGSFDKFIDNIKNQCFDTKRADVKQRRDIIFDKLKTEKLFSKVVGEVINYFDTIKDGTVERLGKSEKDIDYFMRLMLSENVPTWYEISNQMQQIYGGVVHIHGGVRFIEDIKNYRGGFEGASSLLLDVLNRIKTYVENNTLLSYDIDTFIIERDNKRMDYKINQLLNTIYKVPLNKYESYNWEIININYTGLYKIISSNRYSPKPCAIVNDSGCYMFLYRDDLYTPERSYLPFTVVRGNIMMKHKYCELYYIANTIDFNIINIDRALEQISLQNTSNSFQLVISLLLDSGVINFDTYSYLTNLYFRNSGKKNIRLARAIFYGAKLMRQNNLGYDNNYPFLKLDEIVNAIFTDPTKSFGFPDLSFMTNKIQIIRLTSVEVAGVLDLSQNDFVDEVVDSRKLSEQDPKCINPLK